MSDAEFDAESIARQIREVEAKALEALRKAGPDFEPLDDETTQMLKDVNQVVRAERALATKLGRVPTAQEIAEAASLPLARVDEVRRVR